MELARLPDDDPRPVSFGWERSAPNPTRLAEFLESPKLPRLCVVPFRTESNEVEHLRTVFQKCKRIAWAGGEMFDGGDGCRVAVSPDNVYLPNHLDDIGYSSW